MSLRIDTSEWISGALLIGNSGLGVLGSDIPESGDSGAGFAYNDLTLPDDAAKEIRAEIITWPAAGTLFINEDTSFSFDGAPNGTYSFTYQLYVDGVSTGPVTTVYLSVGTVTHTASGALAAGQAVITAVSARSGAVVHSASGGLAADAAFLSGAARRFVTHASSGGFVGSPAVLLGSASIAVPTGPVTHSASGGLVASPASLIALASRVAIYTSAPAGSGYRREMENTTRPKQQNTTRH